MTLFNPCISSIGPRNAKIVAVGEAPGEQEEITGIPFIGWSGQEFDGMLKDAGLNRSDLFLTNLLFTRPPGNKFDAFCVKRTELPAGYNLPPLSQGKYLHPDLICELERLHSELNEVKPNLILAMGGKAAWAILGDSRITKIRGYIHESRFGKVLPILHPATVLYEWSNRVVIVRDLLKAVREQEFPEIIRPVRYVLIDPTLEEVIEWRDTALSAAALSVDSETKGGTITRLGFAHSAREAIVIPFYDPRKAGGSYWSRDEEIIVRRIINRVLSSPVPKLFQNGLYDMQYLLREGYRLCNVKHDSMIIHHAMWPEMPKSLGFLGSIYTNDIAWKNLRSKEEDTLKRED